MIQKIIFSDTVNIYRENNHIEPNFQLLFTIQTQAKNYFILRKDNCNDGRFLWDKEEINNQLIAPSLKDILYENISVEATEEEREISKGLVERRFLLKDKDSNKILIFTSFLERHIPSIDESTLEKLIAELSA